MFLIVIIFFAGNYYFINVPYRHNFYVDSRYYFGYHSGLSASFVFTQQYLTLIRKIVTFDFCLGVGKRVQRPQHDGEEEEEAEADIVFSKKEKKRKKDKKATGAEKKSKGSNEKATIVNSAPVVNPAPEGWLLLRFKTHIYCC